VIRYDQHKELMAAVRSVAISLDAYDHYKRMEQNRRAFTPPEKVIEAELMLNDALHILVNKVGAIIGDQNKGVREDVNSTRPIQE
jgi:hypothetical protein